MRAVVHDIGHGPYSHTFEHIFKTDHEATLPRSSHRLRLSQSGAAPCQSRISSSSGIRDSKTYPNPQVVQMISSQTDADRMDISARCLSYGH